MAKELTFCKLKVNFLAITFKLVDRLISNFEYGKIFRISGLFAKPVCRNKVVYLGEKWLSWVRMYCTHFEALNELILVAASEIIEKFFPF